jgi:hypothetical protein
MRGTFFIDGANDCIVDPWSLSLFAVAALLVVARLNQRCRNVALILTVIACREGLWDRVRTEVPRKRVPGDEGCGHSLERTALVDSEIPRNLETVVRFVTQWSDVL